MVHQDREPGRCSCSRGAAGATSNSRLVVSLGAGLAATGSQAAVSLHAEAGGDRSLPDLEGGGVDRTILAIGQRGGSCDRGVLAVGANITLQVTGEVLVVARLAGTALVGAEHLVAGVADAGADAGRPAGGLTVGWAGPATEGRVGCEGIRVGVGRAEKTIPWPDGSLVQGDAVGGAIIAGHVARVRLVLRDRAGIARYDLRPEKLGLVAGVATALVDVDGVGGRRREGGAVQACLQGAVEVLCLAADHAELLVVLVEGLELPVDVIGLHVDVAERQGLGRSQHQARHAHVEVVAPQLLRVPGDGGHGAVFVHDNDVQPPRVAAGHDLEVLYIHGTRQVDVDADGPGAFVVEHQGGGVVVEPLPCEVGAVP
eukprot:765506-Hanusia_phi.AAC.11